MPLIFIQEMGKKQRKIPKELRQPTAKVVGIIKRNWRQYCGMLQPSIAKQVKDTETENCQVNVSCSLNRQNTKKML